MFNTLTHLQLTNCSLSELPSGFAKLDPNKVQRINLDGNPLPGGAKAILQGSPRDVVAFLKERVEKGEQFLMEAKVLVVGDAAVGKTTLLRCLKGEGRGGDDVGKTTSTDGIEIGELFLGGVNLSCWDFAGQEIYHYTHQFFLSDDAIYLVLFSLSEPFPSISTQLTFWLNSITQRAPSSQVVLIGTHASRVSVSHREKTIQQVRELVSQKLRVVVGGQSSGRRRSREEVGVLVVDSVSGEGRDQVRNALSHLAQKKLQKVPVAFEGIRQMLRKYCAFLESSSQPPVIELKQLKSILQTHPEEYSLMKNLPEKSWELALKILHSLGSIVLIDCWGKVVRSNDEVIIGSVIESEDGGQEDRHPPSDSSSGGPSSSSTSFVVLQPSWLADMFKTVVTFAPTFVKDGVISIERLKNHCWQGYPSSMHELLLTILEQFDVVYQLSRGGGGKVIVPCLLQDFVPSHLGCLVQEDQQEAVSLLLNHSEKQTRRSPGSPSFFSVSPFPKYSPLRRSFLLKKENQQLPVGVMGKMLSSLLEWGKILHVWKTGCVVLKSVDQLVVMWTGWCGSHLGVHFVFFTGGGGEPVPGALPASFSSPSPVSLNSTSSSSLTSCCSSIYSSPSSPFPSPSISSSPYFSSNSPYQKPLPPANTINSLHQATQMMENLLGDYHNVGYKVITPCAVDQEGIPQEWVELKDVFLAVQQNKPTVRTVMIGSGWKEKGDVVGEGDEREVGLEGWLAPDYLLERASIEFFDQNQIEMGELLGKGSFAEVYLAEVVAHWEEEEEERKKIVAVKKIMIDEEKLKEKGKKIEEVLKEVFQETYFSLKVQHPNVVGLLGMCAQAKPPLLLLELLDGVCLFFFFFFFWLCLCCCCFSLNGASLHY